MPKKLVWITVAPRSVLVGILAPSVYPSLCSPHKKSCAFYGLLPQSVLDRLGWLGTDEDKEIADALELPPIKLHCSVLAEETIQTAIKDWEKKTAHRRHNQQ